VCEPLAGTLPAASGPVQVKELPAAQTRYGKPAVALIAYDDFVALQDILLRSSPRRAAASPGQRRAKTARDHPFFNSALQNAPAVEEVMSALRGGRYHGV